MNYTLTRSKRKTCAIYIRNNTVEVRAPLRMAKKEIDRFIDSKADWINTKLAEVSLCEEMRTDFSLDYGDTVRYRGGNCTIIAVSGKKNLNFSWRLMMAADPAIIIKNRKVIKL